MWPKSNNNLERPPSSDQYSSGIISYPSVHRNKGAAAGFLTLSFGMALSAVTAIVWIMHSLIAANNNQVEPRPPGHPLGQVVIREQPIEPPRRTDPPPPPPSINEPPPMPRLAQLSGGVGVVGIPIPNLDGKNLLPSNDQKLIAIMDREVMPLTEGAPLYPSRLLQRGIEGSCAVFYTISATGITKDIVVDESDCTHAGFGRAAAKAVSKYKYAPRIVDGEPQIAPNQRQHFRFLIDP